MRLHAAAVHKDKVGGLHHVFRFSGLTGESDPLVGTRVPIPGCPVTGNFTLQSDGGLRRLTGIQQFVTVRGGAYFFLPSLRAVRYIAGIGEKRQ